jgi:hypothetical protein
VHLSPYQMPTCQLFHTLLLTYQVQQ